jgi:TolA-binding protein
MTEHGIEPSALTSGQLYAVGSALEDLEQFTPAADALRRVALRYPDAAEAETALLKVISLYVHSLGRHSEADALLQMYSKRYPHSSWRTLADDLRRAANA